MFKISYLYFRLPQTTIRGDGFCFKTARQPPFDLRLDHFRPQNYYNFFPLRIMTGWFLLKRLKTY